MTQPSSCTPQVQDRVGGGHPVRKRRLTLALDEDVVDWFRSESRHYRARINAILRAYMERHRA